MLGLCLIDDRKVRGFLLLTWVALLTVSCGTAPIKSYYMLDNTDINDPSDDASPICRLALGLNPVEVSPPYDVSKIIFRPDPLEVRFYTQSQWVSPPEEMFAKLVGRRIEAEHLFSLVDSSVNVSGPHLSLLLKVYAIEEVDRGNDWQARLSIGLMLRDELDDVMLWKHRFDVTEAVEKTDVKSMVQVLNTVYNREIEKAVASMKSYLSKGGCRLAGPESAYREDRDDEPEAAAVEAAAVEAEEASE